jgi:predicted amidohydrolase YtcJ
MADRYGRILLRGGVVVTQRGRASAMLVDGGAVAWVGESASAPNDDARIVELDGRLVTPGFVDAHVHLAPTGFALVSADLTGCASRDEALQRLDAHAADRPTSAVVGHGWDETRWTDRRPPTRDEVDRIVGERPAYLSRVDSHSAVVSSALVARAPDIASAIGWTDDGRVERDAHHLARAAVDALRTPDERRAAVARALRRAASMGVTSVHELNAPHIAPYADFDLIGDLRASEDCPEVVCYWGAPIGPQGADPRLQGYAGDFTVDGAIGSRTAAMHEPYRDAPTTGHLYRDAAAVCDHVVACTRAGVQAGFHVIGDRAVSETVAGLRAASTVVGADALAAARHRVEHLEMPGDDDMKVLADLGVVASVQPAFDAAWGGDGELYEQRLGAERARPMNPFQRMLRAGITLAFGSDTPITPVDPWATVRAATCHHRPDERLTTAEAFEAHTRGGHRARRDDRSGALAPGLPATYAVWDVPDGLDETGLPVLRDGSRLPVCVETVVAGATVFALESAQSTSGSGEERP